jgi:hypothetical protein
MRLRARRALAAAVVFACGVAAAAAASAGSRPASQTVTVGGSSRPSGVVTLVVPGSSRAAAVQAGRDDPAKVEQVPDAAIRLSLRRELRRLDAFLGTRPTLQPYRAHLWYVAHHSRAHLEARQVAALLWCTVWFPTDCG